MAATSQLRLLPTPTADHRPDLTQAASRTTRRQGSTTSVRTGASKRWANFPAGYRHKGQAREPARSGHVSFKFLDLGVLSGEPSGVASGQLSATSAGVVCCVSTDSALVMWPCDPVQWRPRGTRRACPSSRRLSWCLLPTPPGLRGRALAYWLLHVRLRDTQSFAKQRATAARFRMRLFC